MLINREVCGGGGGGWFEVCKSNLKRAKYCTGWVQNCRTPKVKFCIICLYIIGNSVYAYFVGYNRVRIRWQTPFLISVHCFVEQCIYLFMVYTISKLSINATVITFLCPYSWYCLDTWRWILDIYVGRIYILIYSFIFIHSFFLDCMLYYNTRSLWYVKRFKIMFDIILRLCFFFILTIFSLSIVVHEQFDFSLILHNRMLLGVIPQRRPSKYIDFLDTSPPLSNIVYLEDPPPHPVHRRPDRIGSYHS